LVLSSAYRQSSAVRNDAREVDPNNDLLHAMRRRRLDFESMRDTLLQTAGMLDEKKGGRPSNSPKNRSQDAAASMDTLIVLTCLQCCGFLISPIPTSAWGSVLRRQFRSRRCFS
jgi:hypothetical protein